LRIQPYILLFLLCSFLNKGFAQNKVDSLKAEIQKEDSDQEKIILLIELGNSLSEKPDRIAAFKKIFPLAKGDLKLFKGSAHLGIGIIHHTTGQPDSAFMSYQAALPFLEDGQRHSDLGRMYNNMALLTIDKIDTAIYYGRLSLKNRKLSGDSLEVAHGEMLMGNLLDENGVYSAALEHYLNAARIYDDLDYIWGQINTYNNLAILYGSLEEYEKDVEYCQYTVDKILESGDSSKLGAALGNLGTAYMLLEDFDLAIQTLDKSILLEADKSPEVLGKAYYKMGETYAEMGNNKVALDYLLKSHELYLQTESPYILFYSHNKLGEIYLELGDEQKAEMHLLKAYEYGLISDALPDLMAIYKNMSQLYNQNGQYKKAYDFHLLYTATKDAMYSQESDRAIRDMSAKFDSELQSLKIEGLEKDSKIKDIELVAELQKSQAQNRIIWIVALALILSLILAFFAIRGFLAKKRSNLTILEQKKEVEEKNNEILDSIAYAKRIQNAILPPAKLIKKHLANSFVLYKPKDIVAGDFYWLETYIPKKNSDTKGANIGVLFAAADCTGHGVPGAMVSVICNNGLNRSVREHGLTDPGKILDKTREIVIQEFEKSEEDVKDGMDIALCSLEIGNTNSPEKTATLKYAGAHNPLWLIRKNSDQENKINADLTAISFSQLTFGDYTLYEVKADKQPIGKFDNPTPYKTHQLKLNKGDTFYIFSDGYADQFGGEKGKKYKTANFKRLLLANQDKPIEKHHDLIDNAFENWRGTLEQLDDVCVIGIRI
jgi:serine phosphatase RsbU (regulator of sigma subunit)